MLVYSRRNILSRLNLIGHLANFRWTWPKMIPATYYIESEI